MKSLSSKENPDSLKLKRGAMVVGSTAATNFLSKGLQFLLVYQAFALTRPYLGPELFGVFSTILGYGAFLSVLDLGVGNVLIGRIARTSATNDRTLLAQEIRCGMSILMLISVLAAVVFTLGSFFIPVSFFFAHPSEAIQRAVRGALLIFCLGYACVLSAQGVVRILQGLQRAYWAHLLMALAALGCMLLLPWAVRTGQSIETLLLVSYLVPAASPLLLLPVLWRHARMSRWDMGQLRRRIPDYLQNGGIFLLLQLGVLAGWGMDAALVASRSGSSAAGQYAIVQRLFQLVSFPLAIMSAPLWPVYAEAHARSDVKTIQSVLGWSLAWSAILSLMGVAAIVYCHQWMVSNWLGNEVAVPIRLVYFYAAWTVMECIGNAYAMFLNGMSMMKIQLFTNLAFSALAVVLKLNAASNFDMHVLPLCTLLAYGLAIVLPYAFLIKPHALLQQRPN